MVDPVCGMTVTPDETFYFCSVGCMDRFRVDPARYLAMDPTDRRM